jgi:hypothetical protein
MFRLLHLDWRLISSLHFGKYWDARTCKNILASDSGSLENERAHRTRGNHDELSGLDDAKVLRRSLLSNTYSTPVAIPFLHPTHELKMGRCVLYHNTVNRTAAHDREVALILVITVMVLEEC